MDDETRALAKAIFQTLARHERAIHKVQICGTALRLVIRDAPPNSSLEELYAKHYEELSESRITLAHNLALSSIRQMIEMLGGEDEEDSPVDPAKQN
jgi:hypothetical protein